MNYIKEELLTKGQIVLKNYLPEIEAGKAREEIYNGLRGEQKSISSKLFYNEKGSELFEAITELEEYYLTRTEKSIISSLGSELDIEFSGLTIVELGSGDQSKISLLLSQIPDIDLPSIQYVSIDISQPSIEKSIENLAKEYPEISMTGIVSDFVHQRITFPNGGRKLFCFFGSTIGNLNSEEIEEFMTSLGAGMEIGDSLLLGVDMIKDPEIIEKAYNDNQQITAEFNRNILAATNHLAETNFIPQDFEHLAFFNEEEHRIEMHLKALKDMVIQLSSPDDQIAIKKGETIHTENSHKFSREHLEIIGHHAGLKIEKILADKNEWFSLVYYKKRNSATPPPSR